MNNDVKHGVATILFTAEVLEADYFANDDSNLLELIENLKEHCESVIADLKKESGDPGQNIGNHGCEARGI